MKKIIPLLLLCVGLSARAQTTTTNTQTSISLPGVSLNSLGVSTNTAKVANDVISWLAPVLPYLASNHVVTIDLAPVVSAGKFGGWADLQVPLSPSLSLGGGAAYIQDQWFVTLLSTKLGASFTIPVINRPCYAFAETGAAIPVKAADLENQSVAGVFTQFDVNQSLKLDLEGGVGKETSLPGEFYFFGASLNWHFN